MNKKVAIASIIVLVITGSMVLSYCSKERNVENMVITSAITNEQEVRSLFPKTPTQIHELSRRLIAETRDAIRAYEQLKPEKYSFKTVARALDELESLSPLALSSHILLITEMTHPQADMREAAHEELKNLQEFWIDEMGNNIKVYEIFKQYAQTVAPQENLTQEQKYFIEENLKGFKRAGLDLPAETRAELARIRKELATLTLEFERNIAQDNTTILVDRQDLAGMPEDFIDNLPKDSDDKIIVGIDYPTFFPVMENCVVAETRRRLSEASANQAYPVNEDLLKKIIKKRQELAGLLGYPSYADYDLKEQMVKSVDRAEKFIRDLIQQTEPKEAQEITNLLKKIPESVKLHDSGKIQPWDYAFLKNNYKKNELAVDEQKIAEYFPMHNTIAELLDIYSIFLGIEFKEIPVSGFWHEDVRMVGVYAKENNNLLGYLLLDLHPRDNKYTHACEATIIPAGKFADGSARPAVSVVIANFPKPTKDKPSLLPRKDVQTFFHEFGHALHDLLGATDMTSFAGTSVKSDFVEMPSQMLEEWLWDKDILRKVSKHYKTGEPLPEELIDSIVALKTFDTGYFVTRQGLLALLALELFKEGADKEPYEVLKRLQTELSNHVAFNPNTHMYNSFGHLTGYAAKYYGYLLSKVFALDLFEEIEKAGLLNPEIGKKYVDTILSKGGSKDPNELLKDFLGREPNNKAFLRSLGI